MFSKDTARTDIKMYECNNRNQLQIDRRYFHYCEYYLGYCALCDVIVKLLILRYAGTSFESSDDIGVRL